MQADKLLNLTEKVANHPKRTTKSCKTAMNTCDSNHFRNAKYNEIKK